MTQYEKILERLDRQNAEMAAITQEMLTLRQALEDRLPPIPKPSGRRDIVHLDTPRTYQQAMEQNQTLIEALNDAYTHMDEANERAAWERKRQNSGVPQQGNAAQPVAKSPSSAAVTSDKPTDVHIRLKISTEIV